MQQADGQAVTEECWRAAVPLQVHLAENEVSSLEQPPVLYFLVPRQSYLHSVVPRALALLQHLLPPGELAPWFEHGHLPLKWGVPAGVLYDLVAAPGGELPWRLTIHFRGFPDRQLAAYGGESALRGAFFGSLKEAACIARGSAQRVMEMAAGAQEDLWCQVLAGSLQPYSQILASLQLAPVAQRGGRRPAVPLRLYVRRDAGGYLSSYEDIAATSRPVEAEAADGGSISLREVLLPLLAECLAAGGGAAAGKAAPAAQSLPSTPVGRSSSAAGDGGASGSEPGAGTGAEGLVAPTAAEEAAGAAEAEPGQDAPDQQSSGAQAAAEEADGAVQAAAEPDGTAAAASWLEAAAAERRLLVGGVTPPLDAPLAWLHAHLHAADYFLYIVVHAAGA